MNVRCYARNLNGLDHHSNRGGQVYICLAQKLDISAT